MKTKTAKTGTVPIKAAFKCHDCKLTLPVQKDSGTGYATYSNRYKVCYACCALREKASMHKTGRIDLYVTEESTQPGCRRPVSVINWPGTLVFVPTAYNYGRHNLAGTRLDVWFNDDCNDRWHGVVLGDFNEILRCKRLKRQNKI